MPKKRSRQPDWSAVRRDCERGGKTFKAIAAAHGISVSTLGKKRKVWEGLSNRRGATAPQGGCAEGQPSIDDPCSTPDMGIDHLALVQRLYHATDQQIRHLEQQLQNGSAAFDEKEARMLGTIARTLDKIMELTPQISDDGGDNKEACDGNDNGEHGGEDCGSLDLLREELARRLDGLKQGKSGPVSGEPEPQ
ncbi:hypothetical protein [uncultured Cohaesibacter sp.]|uniref:hypothetical protein n=1 Tax=uncultured Cohaesibacter sp. TaxID=1002546 RepID=UPI0029C8CF81|nr:hypothetical protein [uncultured Cohaesibacter sp.]